MSESLADRVARRIAEGWPDQSPVRRRSRVEKSMESVEHYADWLTDPGVTVAVIRVDVEHWSRLLSWVKRLAYVIPFVVVMDGREYLADEVLSIEKEISDSGSISGP